MVETTQLKRGCGIWLLITVLGLNLAPVSGGGAHGTSTGTETAQGIALQAEGEIIVMQQCAKISALLLAYDDVC